MNMNDILVAIKDLSYSQGFYGRLYRDILELKEYDKSAYNNLKQELESQHFKTKLDMILFFEC